MLHSTGRTISHRTRFIALLSATALVAPSFAQSLPTGGTVSAGNAVIGGETNGAITINQGSTNAVINWQSFNIGAGNAVNFVQPDAASAILNRVTGSTTTSIAGQLNANGQVYLINPNGIAITPTGTVNTGAFVASTLGISNDAFMAGGRTFTGNGASAPVSNAGTITIERGGYLALIGGSVANSGTITVPMGKAALGSGEQATLDLSGDGFLQVAIPTQGQGSDALVSNSGTISANGGMVQLTAAAARDVARQAVNMSGTVEARGVSGHSGDITLFGGAGKVVVTGRVITRNTSPTSTSGGNGGSITVASREIELASAIIDASGTTGGGTIHIGGERQGGGSLPHAETLLVDAATTINADAISTGNGGDIVLWSDSLTRFASTISAKGGAISGNGGQVEVSGKARLAYTGFTDLSAAHGAFGTLLLDPYNVTISTGADTGGFTATGNDSVINAATLVTALGGANVTVSTGSSGAQAGNITVAAPLSWTAGTRLTLNAANDITVNAPITFGGAAGAGLSLNAAHALTINSAITVRGIGDVALAYDAGSINNLSFGLTGSGFSGGITYLSSSGGALSADAGGTLAVNGAAYRLIYTMGQLDAIDGVEAVGGAATTVYGAGLSGNYALAGSLDAAGTTYTAALSGVAGTFEGLGHTITGLTIAGATYYVGLFDGNSGTIRDIGIVGGRIEGSRTGGIAAALAAFNYGTVSQSYSTASVDGVGVGGLVGENQGLVSYSYATGTVNGREYSQYAGGLVGINFGDYDRTRGIITHSYATGAVNGPTYVGGLVGYGSGGAVSDSYATGAVSGYGWFVGGLIGKVNEATVVNSFATGTVTGGTDLRSQYVGGLFGDVYNPAADFRSGIISNVYATGSVSGRDFVGGLAGFFDGTLSGAYATGAVAGRDVVGGLIGGFVADPGPQLSQSHASGNVSGSQFVGGLVGLFLRESSQGPAIISQSYSTGNVTGGANSQYVGGLVGLAFGDEIRASYATGNVSGSYDVGGLVGSNALVNLDGSVILPPWYAWNRSNPGWYPNARITQSYATGAVSGQTRVGGLAGFSTSAAQDDTGTVALSYATGAVSGQTQVGGLVGYANGDDIGMQVRTSYAIGAVTGVEFVGGLIGYSNRAKTAGSYATGRVTGTTYVGGLAGWFEGYDGGSSIFASAWDIETSGQTNAVGGGLAGLYDVSGLTTAQARQSSNYSTGIYGQPGFDFTNVWYQSGDMRPILRSEAATPVNGVTTIINLHQLALIGTNLSGSYALGADVDASATAGADASGIWSTAGFVPIGDSGGSFAGTFDGQGHVVSGLVINRPGTDYVGLFGSTGAGSVLRNAGLVNGSISGRSFVGGLAGTSNGSVINTYSTAAISGQLVVGGLIGTNAGSLSQSYSAGSVSGGGIVGGLVGANTGSATQVYATGSVSGAGGIGGLMGENYTSVSQAYATGAVTATGGRGGLIGDNYGTIATSFWDTQTTGLANAVGSGSSAGVSGLTSAQMQNPFTFIDAGWDFASTWATPKAGGAPVLRGLTTAPIYNYYIRIAGNTATTYGDTIGTSGIGLTGIGTGNVGVSWGGAISGTTNVGTYAYGGSNVLALSYSAGVAGDYYVDYGTGALTIDKRALTVAANGVTRAYGDANPALTYSATGLVNGDALSGSLSTTAGQFSNVGTYGITGSFTASANYDLTYVGADLTVTQRALTVTAASLTRRYGMANPALGYRVGGAGLVNGDMLFGSLTTAAGDQSEPGAYAITQGSLLVSANYSLTFQAGALTVESVAPGPGTLASGNATAFGTGPFAQFHPFLPASMSASGGSGILIADPRFGGTVVCLQDGGCATLPANSQL